MKILLDESAPRIIQTQLRELDIRTVQEMGWGGLKNGELLALAEAQFDLFITGESVSSINRIWPADASL